MAKTIEKQTEINPDVELVKQATAAAGRLRAAEQALRDKHAALVRELRDVVTAHPAMEECEGRACRLVDEARDELIRNLGTGIVRAVGGHRELSGAPGSTEERDVPPRLPSWGPTPQGASGPPLTFRDFCAVDPDRAKVFLVAAIRGSGARFGLPREARAAKLAELDEQVGAVEAQHTALVEAAGKVGIALDVLPSVRERREAEARERDRAESLARQREAGIFPVGGPAMGLAR